MTSKSLVSKKASLIALPKLNNGSVSPFMKGWGNALAVALPVSIVLFPKGLFEGGNQPDAYEKRRNGAKFLWHKSLLTPIRDRVIFALCRILDPTIPDDLKKVKSNDAKARLIAAKMEAEKIASGALGDTNTAVFRSSDNPEHMSDATLLNYPIYKDSCFANLRGGSREINGVVKPYIVKVFDEDGQSMIKDFDAETNEILSYDPIPVGSKVKAIISVSIGSTKYSDKFPFFKLSQVHVVEKASKAVSDAITGGSSDGGGGDINDHFSNAIAASGWKF